MAAAVVRIKLNNAQNEKYFGILPATWELLPKTFDLMDKQSNL